MKPQTGLELQQTIYLDSLPHWWRVALRFAYYAAEAKKRAREFGEHLK